MGLGGRGPFEMAADIGDEQCAVGALGLVGPRRCVEAGAQFREGPVDAGAYPSRGPLVDGEREHPVRDGAPDDASKLGASRVVRLGALERPRDQAGQYGFESRLGRIAPVEVDQPRGALPLEERLDDHR